MECLRIRPSSFLSSGRIWPSKTYRTLTTNNPGPTGAEQPEFPHYLDIRRFKLDLVCHVLPNLFPEGPKELGEIPNHFRSHEKVYIWDVRDHPLRDTRSVPTHDRVILDSTEHKGAARDFQAENVMIGIYLTTCNLTRKMRSHIKNYCLVHQAVVRPTDHSRIDERCGQTCLPRSEPPK